MSLVLLIGVDDRTSSMLGGAVPPLMLESARDGRRVLELPPSDLELVVVGGAANDPIAAAQHTRAADPAIAVLMLARPPHVETLRRSILFAPFIGKDVRFVESDDAPAIVAEVRAGLERTRSRRRHRRVIESIDLESPRGRAPRPIDERTLASFLERAPTGIVSVDERGTIASANRAAWELLGADERALLGT
ncbi:MAG: PAS domain-containing protein, partial [Myxococcota bacterium]|nr:PAS domain-containing protein [Myxococcota bacterium]